MDEFMDSLAQWGPTVLLPALAFIGVFVVLTMLLGVFEDKSKRKAERGCQKLRREKDFSTPIRLR